MMVLNRIDEVHTVPGWLLPVEASVRTCPLTRACDFLQVARREVPGTQQGDCSHHTAHSSSADQLAAFCTSSDEGMSILVGAGAREQVLLSTRISTSVVRPARVPYERVWLLWVRWLGCAVCAWWQPVGG